MKGQGNALLKRSGDEETFVTPENLVKFKWLVLLQLTQGTQYALGGGFSGGDFPRWQLSWWQLYWVAVFRVELVLGGDCPRWQLS